MNETLTIMIEGDSIDTRVIVAKCEAQEGLKVKIIKAIKTFLSWLAGSIGDLNDRIKIPSNWLYSEDHGATWIHEENKPIEWKITQDRT